MFGFGIFFILRLERKIIDLVLSSPKSILNLLSTNHLQMCVNSPLNYFSVSITFPRKSRQESSACRNIFDLTAWGMSFTYMKNGKGPRMNLCGNLHVIFEGSE